SVVEADEFDRAFLSLAPTVAVVTNVEADHLECYGTIAALEGAFAQFAGGARRVIAGGDDAGAQRVVARLGAKVWRVGVGADADVKIAAIEFAATGSRATVTLPGGRTVLLALRVPGMDNLGNAAAALGGVHDPNAGVGVGAPIYGARERPLPGVTSDLVARGAIGAGAATVAVRERTALAAAVAARLRAGDVVFTLGAGDVTRIGPELMTHLASASGKTR